MGERRAPRLLHFDGGGARERKVSLVGCALDDEQFIHHTSRSSFTERGSTSEATPCPHGKTYHGWMTFPLVANDMYATDTF